MYSIPSMRSTLVATVLLAAAPLALTGTALAGTSSDSADHSTSTSAHMGAPPRADVKPFEQAKLSLTQAIAEAQKEMRGQTLEAQFEVWHGKPAYLIRTYSAHQIWEGRIDANTGEPLGQPQTVSENQISPRVKSDVDAFQNAQTSLTQAVNKAEQQEGGKAIMASVMTDPKGNASYDLDLVKHGRLHVAMVDAKSGELR